jgi:hypothetical protein
MDGHAQVVELDRLGRATGEHLHIVRPGQLARDHTLRIVVALHDEHLHTRTPQAHHLFAHKQPGVKILPVAVVQVAGDYGHAVAIEPDLRFLATSLLRFSTWRRQSSKALMSAKSSSGPGIVVPPNSAWSCE